MENIKARSCEAHPKQALTFVCLQQECYQVLCADCISTHCNEHHKSKTFPQLKSAEALKQDLSQNISGFLRTLYQEMDDMSLSSKQKIFKALDNAEEEVLDLVRSFFKEERALILKELGANHNPTIDTTASQLKTSLQDKIMSYENLNAEVCSNQTDISTLQSLAKRDFEAELGEILEEISSQLNPLKLWTSDSLKGTLQKCLRDSFFIGKGGCQLFFQPDKRDSDIELVTGQKIIISKKGEKSTPSICLGSALNSGRHSFSVKIETLALSVYGGYSGWVGLGFIENENISLTQNNYSSAICICSDQSFYKVVVSHTAQIAAGNTYHFQVNFETGEIDITGDNGLVCKAQGYQGKTLFPFFELTHQHQLAVFNYKKS